MVLVAAAAVARGSTRTSPTPKPKRAAAKSLLTQVQQFEARRAQLQQRVSLIEQLRKGQSGPVHMLDQISKSLPDLLWLTDMTQTSSDLTMKG